MVIPAHSLEILTCDWNKYHAGSLIATGSVDKTVKVWDLRRPGQPVATMAGHAYAVSSVGVLVKQCHMADVLLIALL